MAFVEMTTKLGKAPIPYLNNRIFFAWYYWTFVEMFMQRNISIEIKYLTHGRPRKISQTNNRRSTLHRVLYMPIYMYIYVYPQEPCHAPSARPLGCHCPSISFLFFSPPLYFFCSFFIVVAVCQSKSGHRPAGK